MKRKKPGLSLGTILTLCLTAAVVAGCFFVFGKIRGKNAETYMDPQRMIGLVSVAIQGPTAETEPMATVQTVTVTLAPVAAVPTASPAPQTASATVPPATNNQRYSFSLTAAGLLSFQSEISDAVYNKTEKSFDYRPIVSGLSSRVCADMNLVTLPQLINTADRKYGDTLTVSEAADAVRALGADQVILGTEHILDQGTQGAVDTVAALSSRGISCEGVTVGAAAQNRVIQLNGGGVAILSYTDVLTAKGKNALRNNASILQSFDLETARRDIQWARSQGARCVIVCLYWGRADASSVTNAQRNTVKSLAEMGADIILGTRPGRVLPMEIISCVGEDGRAREAFAAYSLGTLLTESREGFDISGILLHLDVTCDTYGNVRVTRAEYTPTYIWRQAVNGKTQYRVLCSADPAPAGMSDQQKQVMQRALNRIQTALQGSPVTQRK